MGVAYRHARQPAGELLRPRGHAEVRRRRRRGDRARTRGVVRRAQREREVLLRRRRRQEVPRRRRRREHGDDPHQPGGVPAHGGGASRCSSRTSPATRSAAASRSRSPATSGSRRRAATSSARREVTLGLLPGNGGTQRLTAAARAVARDGAAAHRAHVRPGRGAAVGAGERALLRRGAAVREYARAPRPPAPRLALAAIKRCVHEGGQLPLDEGLALEAELIEQLFRSKDAAEGLTAFVGEAHSRSSSGHDDRRPRRSRSNPGTGELVADVPGAGPRGGRRGGAPRARGAARGGRASATPTAAGSCTRAPRRSRRTSTSSRRSSSPSRARRSARPGSSCTRRPTRSSTTPGWRRQVRGVSVHGLDPGVDGRVLRRPLGVVAAIVPWNFPTTLLCNKLGPALLCGNTVVAKPADTTPLTTLRLGEILAEAGLPPGVFNVVPGHGRGAGEALVTHPLVRKVAFTGSTPIGERVAALAADGLQARDARARRLGPDDHLRRRRPRRPRPARRAWAASTTAARRAWRSSASTCSTRSPTR